MAADKLLNRDGTTGRVEEYLPGTTGGGTDANKVPALDSSGQLTLAMMPTGVGAATVVVASSENLTAGDFVNLYDDSGTTKARKADGSTTGKPAHGYVIAGVTSPANATVYVSGTNSQVTGLTPGICYLSTSTAGATQATVPSGAAKTHQILGYTATSTSIVVALEPPIDLLA